MDLARSSRLGGGPHARRPQPLRVALAAVMAAGLAVGVDALLVHLAVSAWPALRGYPHFRVADYATLTVLGIAGAGVAWPVTARLSSRPGRRYLEAAVAVSIVALLPDGWLLLRGEPGRAVAVLVVMHAVAAATTCPAMLLFARPADGLVAGAPILRSRRPGGHAGWLAMCAAVAVVSLLGLAALAVVPGGRPEALVPTTGRVVYVLHAAAGGLLGIGAMVAAVLAWGRSDRLGRRAALAGLAGTLLGAAGGMLDVLPGARGPALGAMLVGPLVAGFAYLTPVTFAPEPDVPAGGAQGGALSCLRCGSEGTGSGAAPARGAAASLAAGRCPICPARPVRGPGTVLSCRCCKSSFRRIPGDGDEAWVVNPGGLVARPSASLS